MPKKNPTKSEFGYKAVWKPQRKNMAYWREVLMGKKIIGIRFDKRGLSALVFDDGQKLFLDEKSPSRCFVKD